MWLKLGDTTLVNKIFFWDFMRVFLLFLLLPIAALAQPELIAPHQVYGAISYDFNDDGLDDRVLLIADDEYDNWLSLAIYLSGDEGYELAGFVPELVWIDLYPLEKPYLETYIPGSKFVVGSRLESPGRVVIEDTMIFAYRDGEFWLITYFNSSVDEIDFTTERDCYFDLENRRGIRSTPDNPDGVAFDHDIAPIHVNDVNTDVFLQPCPHMFEE